MRRRPLRKRTIGAITLAALMVLVIASSFAGAVSYTMRGDTSLLVGVGSMGVWFGGAVGDKPGFSLHKVGVRKLEDLWPLPLMPRIKLLGYRCVSLPLWPLLALATVLATRWFRQDRRRRSGHCTCGYNLTGNVSGKCPECGAPVAQSVPESN